MQLELLRIMVLMCGRIHLFVLYFRENVQYFSLVVSLNMAGNQKTVQSLGISYDLRDRATPRV